MAPPREAAASPNGSLSPKGSCAGDGDMAVEIADATGGCAALNRLLSVSCDACPAPRLPALGSRDPALSVSCDNGPAEALLSVICDAESAAGVAAAGGRIALLSVICGAGPSEGFAAAAS